MPTTGEILRERRESRGLSLEATRASLGIPLHYLVAMENGSSKLVADEFYLIPFLRRYAEFLELDPASIVAGFLAEAARVDESMARIPKRTRSGAWWITGVLLVTVLGAVALWISS